MKIHKNKKGNTMYIIVAIIIAIVVFFAFYVNMAQAQKTMTSNTQIVPGCKPSNIPVSIKGSAYVKDTAFWGVLAEPDRIDVISVMAGGQMLKGFTSQDYTWKIELIDTYTGNSIQGSKGSNNHPGGGTLIEDKFSINFFLPDNNCDNKIDNFDGTLTFTVTTDDGEVNKIEKEISFQNGKYIR